MSRENSPPILLNDWLNTPIGKRVGTWAQNKLDDMVANIFGFNALQIGMDSYDFLANNRMRNKYLLGYPHNESPAELSNNKASSNEIINDEADSDTTAINSERRILSGTPEQIPFPDQNIDLVILPFILEQSDNPHQVLREVERVLVHEGHIIILGFNPTSLWGLRERLPLPPFTPFECDKQLTIRRLKDWFCLLSLEIDRGQFACYEPACRTEKWLKRWNFMNKAGNRWWASYGSIYLLSATKRACGMTLVGVPWRLNKDVKVKEGQVTANRKPL